MRDKLTEAVGNKLLDKLSQSANVPQLNSADTIPRIAPSFNSVLASTINQFSFGGFRGKTKRNRKSFSKSKKA